MAAALGANLDIEKFIQDVQDRPSIWDRNYHSNKTFLEATWEDLSTEHNLPSKYFSFSFAYSAIASFQLCTLL